MGLLKGVGSRESPEGVPLEEPWRVCPYGGPLNGVPSEVSTVVSRSEGLFKLVP
jgi:hypothetical protein